MMIVVEYLKVFLVGGLICTIGQVLLDFTKLTSARILVVFLLIGVLLEAVGVYDALVAFGGSGATVPITGFGHILAKGAIEGSREGLLEAIVGGMKSAAVGFSAAIIFGYLVAIIFKSHTKKL